MSKKKKHDKKKTKTKTKMPSPEQVIHIAELAKEKEEADKQHQPWVGIITLDIDYDSLDGGSFELDWNDLFITRLMKAGYEGEEDHDLVDQWFNNICRHVVLETFEQEQADPEKRISVEQLDDGRKSYK